MIDRSQGNNGRPQEREEREAREEKSLSMAGHG
jgi:hypothetical protein